MFRYCASALYRRHVYKLWYKGNLQYLHASTIYWVYLDIPGLLKTLLEASFLLTVLQKTPFLGFQPKLLLEIFRKICIGLHVVEYQRASFQIKGLHKGKVQYTYLPRKFYFTKLKCGK